MMKNLNPIPPAPSATPPALDGIQVHLPEYSLKKAVQWSLAVHIVLLVAFTIKGVFFPSESKPYIPALRVDIIGLPDRLTNEAPPIPSKQKKSATAPKPPPAKEDSRPKAPPKKAEMNYQKKEEQAAERKDRMKSALDRIKRQEAIDKIKQAEESAKEEAPIAGNILSAGVAAGGDARAVAKAHYYDIVLEKLRQNWTLPVWLARENLSARVLIQINHQGRVRSLKFLKRSGNPRFDDAVKETIRVSHPFQAPPDELRSSVFYDGILFGFPL